MNLNMTLDRHEAIRQYTGISFRVLVDGVDVTSRCYEASMIEGWADCYQVDSEGHKFKNQATGQPAQERLTGRVRFVRKADVD